MLWQDRKHLSIVFKTYKTEQCLEMYIIWISASNLLDLHNYQRWVPLFKLFQVIEIHILFSKNLQCSQKETFRPKTGGIILSYRCGTNLIIFGKFWTCFGAEGFFFYHCILKGVTHQMPVEDSCFWLLAVWVLHSHLIS